MLPESPRDLRFEGANAPEHRRPRAPNGSQDFALSAFFLQQFFSLFAGGPAGVPIRETQEGLFFEGAFPPRPSYTNFFTLPRDPAVVPIRETQEGALF